MDPKPFQVGIHVRDIEAAMRDLSLALDLTWTPIADRRSGKWDIRVVFSQQGPPFVELVQGPPGSPRYVEDGSRVDHLGYWSDDYDSDRRRLDALGFRTLRESATHAHHEVPTAGLRLEVFDSAARPSFYEHWGLRPSNRN